MPLLEAMVIQWAHQFMSAEKLRSPLPPVSSVLPAMTLADAYRIQAEIVALRVARGEKIVGVKVGATSEAVQHQLGITEPAYGFLFASQQIGNGETITLSALIAPRVECEIGFLLGRTLAGPGLTAAEVLAATELVLPSLEILDCRTRGWRVTIRETVADNGVTGRFVLGPGHPADDLDLAAERAILKKNRRPIAEASGSAVLGHPARAVAWLANKLAEQGSRLEAGQIILPGSLTPIHPVEVGDAFEAVFERLGSVSVSFA